MTGLLVMVGWLFSRVLANDEEKIEAALKRSTPTHTVTVAAPVATAPPVVQSAPVTDPGIAQ